MIDGILQIENWYTACKFIDEKIDDYNILRIIEKAEDKHRRSVSKRAKRKADDILKEEKKKLGIKEDFIFA